MIRISQAQMIRSLVTGIQTNRRDVNKYSSETSSGLKVANPGDSTFAGTISSLQGLSERLTAYQSRVNYVQGYFTAQDDVLDSTLDLLTRAKEIASQGANATNGENERAALSAEVFQLRNQLVTLANTKFQGQYLYSGSRTDTQPYPIPATAQYTNGQGESLPRYGYAGNDATRTVEVAEGVSITMNTDGSRVFDNALWALDRLGRALQGYRTEPDTGQPDGSGTAYVLPDDVEEQRADILAAIDLLDSAREVDINPERTDVAARLNRIQTVESLLKSNKLSTERVLSGFTDADIVDSATKLTMAEEALNASMSVTAKVMGLSILNYL